MTDDVAALSALAQARAACALGHTIEVLAQTASTQDDARQRAVAGARHGHVVVALAQPAGRGRRGRAWRMLDGALACSIVLRPELDPARASGLTLVVGAATLRAVRALGAEAALKWPNDVLLPWSSSGPLGPFGKVAGILVEGSIESGRLDAAIVGVGLNLRGDVPDELAPIATTLEAHGCIVTRAQALAALLAALEALLADPATMLARALDDARAHSATLGRRVVVAEQGVTGRAVAIDDDGALVVEDDDGRRHTVHVGDALPAPDPGRPAA